MSLPVRSASEYPVLRSSRQKSIIPSSLGPSGDYGKYEKSYSLGNEAKHSIRSFAFIFADKKIIYLMEKKLSTEKMFSVFVRPSDLEKDNGGGGRRGGGGGSKEQTFVSPTPYSWN